MSTVIDGITAISAWEHPASTITYAESATASTGPSIPKAAKMAPTTTTETMTEATTAMMAVTNLPILNTPKESDRPLRKH